MRYRVSHRTSYAYGLDVLDAYTVACLLPRERHSQEVLISRITARPLPDEYVETRDVFGNRIVQIGLHQRHREFEIVAESEVAISDAAPPVTDRAWDDVAAEAGQLRGWAAIDVGAYRAPTVASTPIQRRDLLDALAGSIFVAGRPLREAVGELSRLINETFTFDPSATDWATPLDTVLEARRGVCQDFAHLAIATLRSVGLPASYVSGYIETEPPPGEVKMVGADASHAWCSVWTGGVGEHPWLDLDPTNDQIPPARHVTVGWGRDYADVAPVRGVVLGPSVQQSLDVAVDVTRLEADDVLAGAR